MSTSRVPVAAGRAQVPTRSGRLLNLADDLAFTDDSMSVHPNHRMRKRASSRQSAAPGLACPADDQSAATRQLGSSIFGSAIS